VKIGVYIKNYRVTHGHGVREMGDILGIDKSTVSRIERGLPVDTPTMMKLLNYFFGDKV